MFGRCCRAKRGHSIADAMATECHDIHIAFHNQNLLQVAIGLPRLIQPVDEMAEQIDLANEILDGYRVVGILRVGRCDFDRSLGFASSSTNGREFSGRKCCKKGES